METNRQKKISALIQTEIVDILQGEIRKNAIRNLLISVSKVNVSSDLSIAKIYLSIYPSDRSEELIKVIEQNAPIVKHELATRVKNQLRKTPDLKFYLDDSLEYIETINQALTDQENPILNRDLLPRRKKK